MKTTYILGIDTAKHKVRAALSGADERFLFEKDLAASAAGLRELLLSLKQFVVEAPQLLVLIEATGVLHLNWAAALARAGYAVTVLNPLMARRLYSVEIPFATTRAIQWTRAGCAGLEHFTARNCGRSTPSAWSLSGWSSSVWRRCAKPCATR
jgi:Transposase